jgi:hypothetical protein
MKSQEKRVERATAEVAQRLKQQLTVIRAEVQRKHQLGGRWLDGAMVMGLAKAAAEYEAVADRIIEAAASGG